MKRYNPLTNVTIYSGCRILMSYTLNQKKVEKSKSRKIKKPKKIEKQSDLSPF